MIWNYLIHLNSLVLQGLLDEIYSIILNKKYGASDSTFYSFLYTIMALQGKENKK